MHPKTTNSYTYNRLGHDLMLAFHEARKNKLNTVDEFRFEVNFADSLNRLRDEIYTRRYYPSRGIAFITHNPVIREIFAAPFRDRIVHHLIHNYTYPWWDNHFIYDSYSCREEKGTDFAIRRTYKFMRQATHNFTKEAYIFKFDLQGYFMSLDRRRLYDRAIWGLKQQFPRDSYEYRLLSYLWHQIIFDEPTAGVSKRGRDRDWDPLPSNKSLFCQPPGQGIVIGNLTSQLLSNIYLDPLDQFITKRLGIKTYGRYVDDFFFIVPADQKAHIIRDVIPQIENYITGLGLTLHPKKRYIQPVSRGFYFLGVILKPGRILPSKRLTRNFYRACYNVATGNADPAVLYSYLGRLQHLDSKHLIEKAFANVGWDYQYSRKLGPSSLYYTDPKVYEKRKWW